MQATNPKIAGPDDVSADIAGHGQGKPHDHALDYRISFRLLGLRLYFVLLAGIEQRSPHRLHQAGQLRSTTLLAAKLVLLMVMLLGLITMLMAAGIVGLYIVKSLAGIDLFEGESFLHGPVYNQLRR